jgi:hypothetical protein
MGFLDRFRSKKTAPSAVHDGPQVPPPATPTKARIESYVLADAVGILELPDGRRVRFGRTACKGFEPVVGSEVVLEEVVGDARGWKAKFVTLDPSDQNYDSRLNARNEQLGLPPRVRATAVAVATARQLGVITVLLKEALPEGTQALQRWAASLGLQRDGIAVKSERDLEFFVDGSSVLTYPGRVPFPKDDLDARNMAVDFDYGRAFLGFGGTGLPGSRQTLGVMLGKVPDCWAANGHMRALSRLILRLAKHATSVILHRAGDLVVGVDEFIQMLGDLEDPNCRPFAAWLDVAITERGSEHVYATFGMDAFGLPDVSVSVIPADRWSRSRGHEAVLLACYRMVRENRELEVGEAIRVPLRTRVGAWPIELDDGLAAMTYRVVENEGHLRLELAADQSSRLEWQQGGDALAANAYQAVFDCGVPDLVPSDLLRDVPSSNPDVLPHSVEVRARQDGRGFLIVTNGLGRKAHPRGDTVDFPRIEVGAWVPAHSIELVRLVGALAVASHAAEGDAWKPGDTLTAPVGDLGIAGFLLADGGKVEMGGGPDVRLLLLVPLTSVEYQRVRGGGGARWLAQHEVHERLWSPFLPLPSGTPAE